MQPSRNQVEQSLAALAGGASRPSPVDTAAPIAVADVIGSLPEGLLDEIGHTIDIRPDRLELAREHLAHLDELTADELADCIVGRLVCDRLR
jgi:hypothetical protein